MSARANNAFAVIYTRVSSEAQVDGTSLDLQREACRACAARHGLTVLSEHEDAGKSARSVVGRDALAAAVDAATSAGAALVVYKFDRLSRNLGDGYSLRDALVARGCRIISATEGEASSSPVSKAMYAMMMAFAELDNDMRTERCRAGMRARALQGGWNSNPPAGFRLDRNAAGIPVLVPDGELSEILRKGLKAFAEGRIDKSALIQRLTAAGIPDSSISRMIRNPVYGGIIRNGLTDGEDVPAAFPGLVTADEWRLIEARLRGNPRAKLKHNPAFPYVGTVCCAVCGQPLRAGFSTSRGRSFGYYFCRATAHPKIRREDLHGQVGAMLTELGQIGTFLETIKKAVLAREVRDPYKDERERHARIVARLEPQLARLRAALLDGTFTREEYDAERARIITALEESKAWLRDHADAVDRRGEYLDLLIGIFSEPAALLAKLNVAQTKTLIRILFHTFNLTAQKRIEPSQDSIYKVLTTAQATFISDGRPSSSKFETWAEDFTDALSKAAEELSKLLVA